MGILSATTWWGIRCLKPSKLSCPIAILRKFCWSPPTSATGWAQSKVLCLPLWLLAMCLLRAVLWIILILNFRDQAETTIVFHRTNQDLALGVAALHRSRVNDDEFFIGNWVFYWKSKIYKFDPLSEAKICFDHCHWGQYRENNDNILDILL